VRRERETGRPDVMCVCVCERERERERGEAESYLHIFLEKLEHSKVPLFMNIDVRELDVSSLV
jgi:hypothetical protein